jgi:hypothetical protein
MVVTFKKFKIHLPYPSILLLAIYQKEAKSVCQRDICTPIFITALFTNEKRKQPDYRWIKKISHTHTAIENDGILLFAGA